VLFKANFCQFLAILNPRIRRKVRERREGISNSRKRKKKEEIGEK